MTEKYKRPRSEKFNEDKKEEARKRLEKVLIVKIEVQVHVEVAVADAPLRLPFCLQWKATR